LSINVIKNISKKTSVTPSKYSKKFISIVFHDKEKIIIKKPWQFRNNDLTSYSIQFKDNIKTMHLLLIANDKTDTLFIMWFESPPNSWDKNWKIGNTILNNLQIDEKI
jgi:hypothetical protein